MKKFFFVVSLIFLCSCMSQKRSEWQPKLSCVNIVDRNGLSETISGKDRLLAYQRVNFLAPQPYQKVIRVYSRKPNGDIPSEITTYHPNGQIKQYLEVLNNRAFGCYQEWHENGLLKVKVKVIGGSGDLGPSHENTWLFDGECRAWDEEGCLEAKIDYCRGVQQGESLYYHKNGTIWKKIPYDKGEKHGLEETFLHDGRLLQSFAYCCGKKEGKATRYWNETKIAAIEIFENDKIKEGTYYDNLGNRICSIVDGEGERALFGKDSLAELHEYHRGELDGKVQMFNPSGEMYNVFHVKNGLKHGEDIEFYPSQSSKRKKQKMSIQWVQGSIQGMTKTWYPNGNQESQREMSHNQKNGLSTAWYENGSLMLIEEYEKDVLKSGKYFKIGCNVPISQVKEGNGVATIFDSEGNFLHRINYHYGKPEI